MSLTHKTGLIALFPGVANARIPKDIYYDGDDFTKTLVDDEDYACDQYNSTGTWANAAAGENGILLLDSACATASDGVQIQRPAASFLPKAGRTIIFSTRLKTDDLLANAELFFGLAEIDTSIIAAHAISTANHIGFSSITTDGILLANCEKAGAGTTKTAVTSVEATYLTLGFVVNGLDDVTFYADGVEVAKIDTTANIPIVGLSPSFVCGGIADTSDPIVSMDYWVCEQTR